MCSLFGATEVRVTEEVVTGVYGEANWIGPWLSGYRSLPEHLQAYLAEAAIKIAAGQEPPPLPTQRSPGKSL